jgi:hypothetical protein
MSTLFRIRGIVREAETGIGVANVLVKAHDKDLLFDDLLGHAVTGYEGTFEIVSESEDFRDFFEKRPDIHLRVLHLDGEQEIYSTARSVRWEAGRVEYFEVDVPGKALGQLRRRVSGRLLDEQGEERSDYDAGESLVLDVSGLAPVHVYHVSIIDAEGSIVVSARLITNRQGELSRVVVWPQLGLGGGDNGSFVTPEAAEAALAGREFVLRVAEDERVLYETRFRFADAFRRPLLYACDGEGRLLNGFQLGQAHVHVSGRNFPPGSTAGIVMVPRQFDWRPGDPIEPVVLADERIARGTVQADERGAFVTRLVADGEVEPGSYQFIARVASPEAHDVRERSLHRRDVVSSRRFASLVVRRDFWEVKAVRGGCVMSHDMAGRTLAGRPYFQFTNTFQVGDDVWAALDPAGVDPGLIGKKVAIYVIQDKTAAEWTASLNLQHLAVLGGNPAVQEFVTQAGCINFNDLLVWPNASIPGKYEIVADFGNNPPTPATFTRDNLFGPPLDMIDGYFGVGFNVVEDPTTTAAFGFAGTFEYNEGITQIDAPGEFPNPHDLEQKAVVYFPADIAGATNPSQISAAQAQYPLVVVVHGNSGALTSYKGYNYLLDHLARNGMIAASIHVYPNAKGVSRARALLQHLAILQTKFPGKIDLANVGIMGHSRGGEAVVIASKLNVDEALGYNFKAIISLAPTDQYGPHSLTGAYHRPYLVIYGSLDGDLIDGPAFRLYDRADPLRAMVFVEGACHDRFNTEWDDNDFYFSPPWGLPPADQMKVTSLDAHQKIAKGYMNAFFRWHLLGRTELTDFFTGELTPAQVETADGGTIKLHFQYQAPAPVAAPAPLLVDRFNNGNWQLNDLGGSVTDSGTLPVPPGEGALKVLDVFSPHDTTGAQIRWDGLGDVYLSDVPAPSQDVSAYEYLQFRVTQRYGSASNPVNTTQDMYVKLRDKTGNARSLLVSKFATIPYPYVRGYNQLTKSALKTVRIPLAAYQIEVLGAQGIDLTKIESITFEFATKPTGEIEIDDIEFGY